MRFIKNYPELATTDRRKIALKILEAGLSAIQPKNLLSESVRREGNSLFLKSKRINLDHFERVHMIGFGKGAAEASGILEKVLGSHLTDGRVIDTKPFKFRKIKYTVGTHPLPSKQNIEFTETVLKETEGLTEKDLVLIVICGGGSALFEAPFSLQLKQLAKVSSELINSGADIAEINVVRKHLSKVKGGGLAKHLYPAKVVNLIFSDVPGNDLNVIASNSQRQVDHRARQVDLKKIQDKPNGHTRVGFDRTSKRRKILREGVKCTHALKHYRSDGHVGGGERHGL